MERGNWDGKRVLVTGAGGFIGSHLTEYLCRAGADVRAMVHYNALGRWGWLDHSEVRDDIEVVMGDIADRDSVRKAVEGNAVVMHLAALIGIPYSYEAPQSYVNVNINGTLNILQSALDCSVERVVHTSTSETYGSALYAPIDEAHPLQGQSPYAATKIGADKLAESFYCSFGLPVVLARPFNTYGPRQSTRAIIPTIISQALTRDIVQVGSTTPTRDLNFVEDTVRGFIAAAEADDSSVGQVYNIGSGKEISIGDLAELIVGLCGAEVQIVSRDERKRPEKSEVNRLLANNSRAGERLRWQPQISLSDGLMRTIEWFKQPHIASLYHNERYGI